MIFVAATVATSPIAAAAPITDTPPVVDAPAAHLAFTGTFAPDEPAGVLDARWRAEVDRVAATLPWIVRGLVRSRLRTARPTCDRLDLTLTGEAFRMQCDASDPLERRLDGAGEPLLNRDGEPVHVDLRVSDDTVHLSLSSPKGAIATTYERDGDQLIVRTVTRSPHTNEPFHWTQSYRRTAD